MSGLSSDTKKFVRECVREEFGKVKDTLLRSLVELMEKEYREVATYVQNKELKESVIPDNIVVLEGDDKDLKPPPLQPKQVAKTAEDELRSLLGEEGAIKTEVPEAVDLQNSVIDIGENISIKNVDIGGNVVN